MTSKTLRGHMTAVFIDGLEFGIYARTQDQLNRAFLTVTGGKIYFQSDKANHVEIRKVKLGR